ncbi:MAG TPA: C69 family dipeptidase [Acidimicrobiales bacterium]|nr:C69 family dipeptidase [Acidimicrobiales bacterium]
MCDCLVALRPATRAGATIFAKNSDRPPAEAQPLEQHSPRRDDGPLQCTHIAVDPAPGETIGFVGSRPWWCWGVEHGVNDAGVAIGNEAIYTTLDPRTVPPALIGMDLVRLGLERAATAATAVEVMVDLLERHGQGGTGHHGAERPYWSSFLVADGADAWVLETSGRTWATERVARSRAVSNRTTIPSFDAEHRHPRQPVATLVDPRLDASRAVLAAEPVRVDDVVAHLRSHVGEEGFTVCMHAGDVEATTASMVVELAGTHPLARWLLGSPCTSVYVPVHVGRALGEPPAWERFVALQAEHRPALSRLEAALVADVVDEDAWGPEAWRRVDDVLAACGV